MVRKSGSYLSSALVSLAALLGQVAISGSASAAVTCDFDPPGVPFIRDDKGLLTCFEDAGFGKRIAYVATFEACGCGTTIGPNKLTGISDPGDICQYPIWVGPNDKPSQPNFTCEGGGPDWQRYESSNPRPYARIITYVNPDPRLTKPIECTPPPAPLDPLDQLPSFNPPDGCSPRPEGVFSPIFVGIGNGGIAYDGTGLYGSLRVYFESLYPKLTDSIGPGPHRIDAYYAGYRGCPCGTLSNNDGYVTLNADPGIDVCRYPIYQISDDVFTLDYDPNKPGIYPEYPNTVVCSLDALQICDAKYKEVTSIKRRITQVYNISKVSRGYYDALGFAPGTSFNTPLPPECDGTPSQPAVCHNPYVAGQIIDTIDAYGSPGEFLTRAVPFPAIIKSEERKTAACNPVPVDCQWSEWSDYGACSANACGTSGTRTSSRSVLTQASGGGQECTGDSVRTEACSAPACPVDCVVSPFEDSTSCSAACGGGTKTQTRTILTEASGGGLACPSDLSQTVSCNTQDCPVDCVVSAFGPFGDCSATACGTTGTKTQTRTVLTPASGGGLACPALSNTQACSVPACPPPPPPPPPSKLAGSCDFSGVRLLWPPNNKMVTIGRVTLAPGAYLDVYSDERTSSKGHDDDRDDDRDDKYWHGDDHKKKYGSSQNKNYSGGQCNGKDDDDDDYNAYDASLIKGVFSLRATRLGYGDGRVYLAAIKGNGLTTVNCGTVVVPHDQSQRSLNSARSQGTTAAAFLRSSGLPPANFFKLEVKK